MKRATILLALLLACGPLRTARAYETRHVVIVVVDGARHTETFGDPTFAHVPLEAFVLAPQGCRGNSWNQGLTVTVPGHAAILSGVYQVIANDGSERPHLPLVFEYYRAATGAPRAQAWFFSDKEKLDVLSNSDHPDYGDSLGAFVDVDCPTDSAVVARAEATLLADHPAIVALNLAQTDLIAHTGDWEGYLAAIQTADSLVTDLWLKIQADTALAGRTALFVTNDHGRHDDAHGGFESHGCGCEGCRHVQMLVLGPDFKADFVSPARAQPVDIVPTAGVIMGFPTPLAAGRVMDDMLLVPHGPLGVAPAPGGPGLRFGAPIPHPARGAVRLPLELPVAGELTVDVLDAQGRRVATIERGPAGAGAHPVTWSGRTARGHRAAPGAYFVRARLDGREAAIRVVLR